MRRGERALWPLDRRRGAGRGSRSKGEGCQLVREPLLEGSTLSFTEEPQFPHLWLACPKATSIGRVLWEGPPFRRPQ